MQECLGDALKRIFAQGQHFILVLHRLSHSVRLNRCIKHAHLGTQRS